MRVRGVQYGTELRRRDSLWSRAARALNPDLVSPDHQKEVRERPYRLAGRRISRRKLTVRDAPNRSVQMVRRYIREGTLFRENSGAKLGL